MTSMTRESTSAAREPVTVLSVKPRPDFVETPATGSMISLLLTSRPPSMKCPPTTSTLPSVSSVAMCPYLDPPMMDAEDQAPVAGLYTSAEER